MTAYPVKTDARYTRLIASQTLAVFYDGADLYVFDVNDGSLNRFVLDYQFYFTTILVSSRAVLFYGG